MLEWDSIAQGWLAADALLKEAEVATIAVRPVTPGRFVALFSGDVESVRSALGRGIEVGGDSVIDSLFLPAPHPGLTPAIAARSAVDAVEAVGVIETLSLCSLVLAADGAAKSGSVELLEIRLAMGLGGKAFCVLSGEVSDVEAAVARGTDLARERGHHLRSVVIPRPDERTVRHLLDPQDPFSDFVV
ncbi:MAG: propanediol utilization protein [Deltaproteobacteria bacterium]|nr:propanediol utilization protein [Deltaproteobacteria bacterium]